jgi:hypothetical protein
VRVSSLESLESNFPPVGQELVTKGLQDYFHTGVAPEYLADALHQNQFPFLFRDGMENVYDNPTVCYYCNLAVDLVIGERLLGLTAETLAKEAEYLCVHLGIESRRVCTGVIDLNLVSFVGFWNSTDLVQSGRFPLHHRQLPQHHVESDLWVCLARPWMSSWRRVRVVDRSPEWELSGETQTQRYQPRNFQCFATVGHSLRPQLCSERKR